jgi:hypothetical protein
VAPATLTDVTVTPTAPTEGTSITFTATVDVGVGSLTGTVGFFIDGTTTPADTVALVDGDASFTASGTGRWWPTRPGRRGWVSQ